MELTTAEENYLKAIYHLSEEGKKSVSTNDIAAAIQTKPASVSDMLRKLGEKEVIQYRKYYGLQITELGKRLALQTIRKHRLWEVFLVDKLHFAWDEVHEVESNWNTFNLPYSSRDWMLTSTTRSLIPMEIPSRMSTETYAPALVLH
jgi:DtxR family Mn-dependent transcriptional regulator